MIAGYQAVAVNNVAVRIAADADSGALPQGIVVEHGAAVVDLLGIAEPLAAAALHHQIGVVLHRIAAEPVPLGIPEMDAVAAAEAPFAAPDLHKHGAEQHVARRNVEAAASLRPDGQGQGVNLAGAGNQRHPDAGGLLPEFRHKQRRVPLGILHRQVCPVLQPDAAAYAAPNAGHADLPAARHPPRLFPFLQKQDKAAQIVLPGQPDLAIRLRADAKAFGILRNGNFFCAQRITEPQPILCHGPFSPSDVLPCRLRQGRRTGYLFL